MRAWTKVLPVSELRAELDRVLATAMMHGANSVEATFGFAWGNDYYPGNEWPPVVLAFDELDGEIQRAAGLGWGKFGENDLWLRFPPLDAEVLFCHEADVHLEAPEDTGFAGALLERWAADGLLLRVDRDADPGPEP